MSSKIAGQVSDFNPEEYFDKKDIKKLDIYTQFALVAAREAVKDANLTDDNYDSFRAGCIIGAGIGGIWTFQEETAKFISKGPRRVSPFFIPKMISNIAAGHIAIEHKLKGINFNVSSACASANHAIGTSLRAIQYGDADIIVSGGAEGAVNPMALAGFAAMKALSTRNDEPQKASRPFDKDRDGFVMGEGAGMIVMEELEHALARGAKIYAEIVGYGATCDAYHVTAPADGGEGSARAIDAALNEATLSPEQVDYFNAHGTSTPLNDKNETAAIKTIFGAHTKDLAINSTKSMVGHMLGAAAGVEAIVCCLSIRDSKIHATINAETPDPNCDLNYTPNNPIERNVDIAISNSLGFGGHNSAVIFKKYNK
ncbi:MAG: beta-ketoacyl-[acyl-carrier-protein] synthase II [Candidatus Cloacimonetes bacterium 4572_65]|nr:MAG: beta-ketoacyl-[acyl-carrier-protein] synthase II [Candidatus Cloacimonetes bacterium 4572_65]